MMLTTPLVLLALSAGTLASVFVRDTMIMQAITDAENLHKRSRLLLPLRPSLEANHATSHGKTTEVRPH